MLEDRFARESLSAVVAPSYFGEVGSLEENFIINIFQGRQDAPQMKCSSSVALR